MYYYYWATAAGYKIWWKRYVTVMQISQFILDLGLVYFGSAFMHTVPTGALSVFSSPKLTCLLQCARLQPSITSHTNTTSPA
jgi:hypothetical protein